MNLRNVFTKMDKFLQEHLKIWDYKILPHFPDNLDETAAQSGALQRKRGIHSVYDLLKLFFLYACSSLSFRVLAVAACTLGISSVSDTALRKRFSKAAPFLHEVLHTMLSSLFSNPASALPHRVKNIFLVDASIIRQTGICQEQERIHLCYSLNQNRMKQIKVTNHHTAESLSYFTFEKGDLVMADAGYAAAQNYIYAQEQQADVILRITPKTFCLYDADDKKISLVSLLKQAEDQGVCMVEVFGICRYKSKTGFVRILCKNFLRNKHAKPKNASREKPQKTRIKLHKTLCFAQAGLLLLQRLE